MSIPFQAGAQGALEVFGAGELHAELLDLSGGFPLVGADAFQEGFALVGTEGVSASRRSVASSRSRIWSRVKPSGFMRRMTMRRATSVSV